MHGQLHISGGLYFSQFVYKESIQSSRGRFSLLSACHTSPASLLLHSEAGAFLLDLVMTASKAGRRDGMGGGQV